MPVSFGGHNLPHLVEIRLTDLPKSAGTMAPPEPPGVTGLPIGPWVLTPLLLTTMYYLY